MPISGIMHTGSRLAFVSCESSASAGAGSGAGQSQAHGRREVVVSGKRIKTIDVHAHCIVPEAAPLINHPLEAPGLLWSNVGDRGVGVAGSVAGEELAHPKFHPFWAKCEALGVLVFMHPLGTRELGPSGRLAGNGRLTNTIGNPLETTTALLHLIFEGTLDRFPGLKICAAHGGGFP